MKGCLRLLLAAAMLFAGSVHAQVADWPRRSVRIVVPFPVGGSNDQLCRVVGAKLAADWKQPIFFENKPGDGGNLGAEAVYAAPGDGYTLLCSPPGPLSINHNLYRTLPYDWTKFVPITVLAVSPNVIAVRKDLPANTAQELIAYAKANPGKLTYASQGNGSTSHLSAEMLEAQAGIDMVKVTYNGEGPAIIDLAAGKVDVFVGNISAVLKPEQSGRVKFLGLAARRRSPVATSVPAAPEFGLPNLIATAWFALVAPPGTPDPVVQKINRTATAALMQGDVRSKFYDQGAEPVGGTPSGTANFIREEEARWRTVIRSANISLE